MLKDLKLLAEDHTALTLGQPKSSALRIVLLLLLHLQAEDLLTHTHTHTPLSPLGHPSVP